MKNHPYFKSLYITMIGLVGVSATVSAPQAADIGAPVLERWVPRTTATQPQVPAPAEAAPAALNDTSLRPLGAQGPIRTEFDDRTARVDQEMIRRDLQMERYPVSGGVGIP